jgi:hypothetical protein
MDKIMIMAIKAMFKILGIPGKEYLINQVVQKIEPILLPLLEEKQMKLSSLNEANVMTVSPDKRLKEIGDLHGDIGARHSYEYYTTDAQNLKNLDVAIKALKKYHDNLKQEMPRDEF